MAADTRLGIQLDENISNVVIINYHQILHW